MGQFAKVQGVLQRSLRRFGPTDLLFGGKGLYAHVFFREKDSVDWCHNLQLLRIIKAIEIIDLYSIPIFRLKLSGTISGTFGESCLAVGEIFSPDSTPGGGSSDIYEAKAGAPRRQLASGDPP
jgi:hypothetical protein